MQAWRLAEIPWMDRTNPVTGLPYKSARLMQDADTGMEAIMVDYPAGSMTPLHEHTCGHGLLVIAGLLETQDGKFGPGDLVWYPEGSVGTHGAGAEVPVKALLFTNNAFGIRYLEGTRSKPDSAPSSGVGSG
jgi:quercetin dioxygenase-like cupin family protein